MQIYCLQINKESFFNLTKFLWIGDSDASCHITDDDTRTFDVTKIDKFNMMVVKKGKLCVKERQIDGGDILHTLCPVKYCKRSSVNLFSLSCKLAR